MIILMLIMVPGATTLTTQASAGGTDVVRVVLHANDPFALGAQVLEAGDVLRNTRRMLQGSCTNA